MSNPLRCERCGQALESDDAISIIEGVCAACRGQKPQSNFGVEAAPPRRIEPPRVISPRVQSPNRPMNYIPPPSVSFTPPPTTPRPAAPQGGGPAVRPPIGSPRPIPGIRQPILPGFEPAYEAITTARLRRRRRDLLVGVSVGLIITVAITSYLLSGRTETVSLHLPRGEASLPVTLTVKPAWATITMDGKPVGPADSNGRIKLDLPNDGSSSAWLEVAAKGYHSIRRPVSVYGGIGDVNIELIQKPYELAIRTSPADAEVWINNELKGRTPTTLTLLPGEKARLAVKRPGYETITKEIAPPVDAERVDVDLAMRVTGPSLAVETDPPGAQVLINGQPRGVSPVDLRLEPGWMGKTIQLTADLAGYETTTTNVDVPSSPGTSPPRTAIKLAALAPRIEVTTQPPGGTVLIDGEERGVAPVNVKLPAGRSGSTVVIEASLGASRYGKQELTVPSPGQTARLAMALQALPTGIVFVLAPAAGSGADHFALLGHVNEEIHRLAPDQRFAVVVSSPTGPRVWPEDGTTPEASSGQKIRAYDMVRSIRPESAGDLAPALDAALRLKPTTIWLVTANEIDGEQLDRLGAMVQGRSSAIHIVTTLPGAQEPELRAWTSQHRGTLTVLGRARGPHIAFEPKTEP